MRKIVISRKAGITYTVASVVFLCGTFLIASQTAVAVGSVLAGVGFATALRVAAINGHMD